MLSSTLQNLRPRLAFGCLLVAFSYVWCSGLAADEFNYDESKVPKFELPDALKAQDGTAIDWPELWHSKRRPELLKMFEEQVFGKLPEGDFKLRTKVRSEDPKALNGLALRREVTVFFTEDATVRKWIF